MSNRVLILQNISHEGPGLLSGLLHELSIEFDSIDLSAGQTIPSLRGYAAVVLLGGPQSANDPTSTMADEIRVVREILDAAIPCLGICLGLQVLVKAAGGTVWQAPAKEVGFREPDGTPFTIMLTPEGRRDPLFDGLPDALRVFQLHGETVEPTSAMALLGTGVGCRNQVVRIGRCAWGLQCHFELTRPMFESWLQLDHDLGKMDRHELLDEFDRLGQEYTRTGRRLLLNFLGAAGFDTSGAGRQGESS